MREGLRVRRTSTDSQPLGINLFSGTIMKCLRLHAFLKENMFIPVHGFKDASGDGLPAGSPKATQDMACQRQGVNMLIDCLLLLKQPGLSDRAPS